MDPQLVRAALVSTGLVLLLVLVAVASPRPDTAADADLPRAGSAAPIHKEDSLQ